MATAKTNVRKFGSVKKDAAEPIKFEIADVELEALRDIPVLSFLEFAELMSDDAEGENTKVRAINMYIKDSFDAANFKKFKNVTARPDVAMSTEELMEVVQFLIEERSGGNPSEQ